MRLIALWAFTLAAVLASAGSTSAIVSAKPAAPADFFRVLRSDRDRDDRLAPTVRLDLLGIEENFGIDVDRSGIRQVYRRKGTRVWLVPGKGWLCLVIKSRGGAAGCRTLGDARRGRLGMTFGAGSRGAAWVEHYHVIPDGAKLVRITSENGRAARPKVKHNALRAFFPTPAELTFELDGGLVRHRFPDAAL